MVLKFRSCVVILIFIALFSGKAQDDGMPEANQICLTCHGNQIYNFYNEWLDTESKRIMNPFYIIDTTAYVNGVHGTFNCTDCHSPDYENYPHNAELKLEPLNTCLDCHGGDDIYADYHFDEIEEEFYTSVHYEVSGESFSCSKCHSQHYYQTTARRSENVQEIVGYNNGICLSCHDDRLKFQTVSGDLKPQLSQIHDWLPNQELHFSSVRCIECHTKVDTLMVAHNIRPKEEAVRNCNECHSSNSLLKATLYKYENIQARSRAGKIGALIQNEAYIIGANQFPLLKTISFIIFGLVIVAVGIHWILRIKHGK